MDDENKQEEKLMEGVRRDERVNGRRGWTVGMKVGRYSSLSVWHYCIIITSKHKHINTHFLS